jgi:hypothetical protein
VTNEEFQDAVLDRLKLLGATDASVMMTGDGKVRIRFTFDEVTYESNGPDPSCVTRTQGLRMMLASIDRTFPAV